MHLKMIALPAIIFRPGEPPAVSPFAERDWLKSA
jgi:hypothetical protein